MAINVVDSGNHRIQTFSASGQFLNSFGRFGRPFDFRFSNHFGHFGEDLFCYPEDICFIHSHFAPSTQGSEIIAVTGNFNRRITLLTENQSKKTCHLFDFQTQNIPSYLCVDLCGYLHVSFRKCNKIRLQKLK